MEEAYLGERGASRRGHVLVLVGGSVEGRGRQAHGRSPRKEGRARSSPRRLVGALVRAAPPRNSQTPLPPSSRPAISRGSRWALTGGAPTSSHARGQRSEPPWNPPQNSGCGPCVPPPPPCGLARVPWPCPRAPPGAGRSSLQSGPPHSCSPGSRRAEPGRGRRWGLEGSVVGAGRGAAAPCLPGRARRPARDGARRSRVGASSPPPPRGLFLRRGPRAARPCRGHLCLAALQSMREDPDPTVSCLATQTYYVVEAKEAQLAQPSTSCFCTRRP